MPKGKITDAWAKGTTIMIAFLPSEGNIRGKLNLRCPESLANSAAGGRPPRNELSAGLAARKLIGREYDISIPNFGAESKQSRKARLKKLGVWCMKDNKMEVSFIERKLDGVVRAYSDYWEQIEAVPQIERLDDLDINGGKLTFFIKDGTKKLDVVRAIEKLDFVEFVKNAKKVEVR